MFKKYISSSSENIKNTIKNFSIMGGMISVVIEDPLPDSVNFKSVVSKVRKIIPDIFFFNIQTIYIGDYDHFSERGVNAYYKDARLFLTNAQKSEEDMVDDIVHELAHSIEDFFSKEIYTDGLIRAEFLAKRNKLLDILGAHGYNIPGNLDFMNPEYSQDLDDFFYREIGYPKMANFIRGLFLGPYSTTSIHEYFAAGFEDYFINIGLRSHLKVLCPILYKKIHFLERELSDG